MKLIAICPPTAPRAHLVSLPLLAHIVCFLISMFLWGLLFLALAGCARSQPPCVGCYIGLQQVERTR